MTTLFRVFSESEMTLPSICLSNLLHFFVRKLLSYLANIVFWYNQEFQGARLEFEHFIVDVCVSGITGCSETCSNFSFAIQSLHCTRILNFRQIALMFTKSSSVDCSTKHPVYFVLLSYQAFSRAHCKLLSFLREHCLTEDLSFIRNIFPNSVCCTQKNS